MAPLGHRLADSKLAAAQPQHCFRDDAIAAKAKNTPETKLQPGCSQGQQEKEITLSALAAGTRALRARRAERLRGVDCCWRREEEAGEAT